MMKKISVFITIILLLGTIDLFAVSEVSREDSTESYNWFNLDKEMNGIPGISTDKAYNELLKNKKSTSVIVAVIDGGVDINHEDLKGKVWINGDEIPGNGIDDDKNGFIDDINGWNFLGNAEGKNIKYENYEATRIYMKYNEKFSSADTINLAGNDLELFSLYKSAKKYTLKN